MPRTSIVVSAVALAVSTGTSFWMSAPIIAVIGPFICVAAVAVKCYSRSKTEKGESKFEVLFRTIRDTPDYSPDLKSLVSQTFGSLTASHKLKLLKQHKDGVCMATHCHERGCAPLTCLEWLLERESNKSRLIVKSLLNGLPLEERMGVTSHVMLSFPKDFSHWMADLDTLKILFGRVTPEDRLKLLVLSNKGIPIFIKLIQAMTRLSIEDTKQIDIINFLFSECPSEQLKPPLVKGWILDEWQHSEFFCAVTALEVAVDAKTYALANVLIEYGALEGPEFNFEELTKCPYLDITPYRKKLGTVLQGAGLVKDAEEIVVDYLVSETASRKSI